MPSADIDRSQAVYDYHQRTKHHYQRMARSSGFMDWANQPDPFRRYAGAAIVSLPLSSTDPDLDYNALYTTGPTATAPLDKRTIATFLELSLGLSAWKAIGRDRWALRINPSSGNLHPTETYLLTSQIEGLPDGLYHYAPREHILEQRMALPPETGADLAFHCGAPALLLALSSILWREAWKYGERAFRYCQHDIGHALAALRFSARLLGWRLTWMQEIGEKRLARLLGFDRTDWQPLEEEIPEVLVLVTPSAANRRPPSLPKGFVHNVTSQSILGQPNQLSPECRQWEIIRQVALATRQDDIGALPAAGRPPEANASASPIGRQAATIIRQRRSAVAFDHRGRMDQDTFFHMLTRTHPRGGRPPFDVGLEPAQISLLLFVHQVSALAPGMYLFLRQASHREALQKAFTVDFVWQRVTPGSPLYLLKEGDYRSIAADLACRQDIAGASVFSLAMLTQFQAVIEGAPWRYRHLFWEAGMIGQVLYLEAEARGFRGTGIGCYFDDPVHDLLGIHDQSWQDLYHFTVGLAREDPRLQTFPPYAHLDHKI
jgi:SagB-type dehydrogenase family enzyme